VGDSCTWGRVEPLGAQGYYVIVSEVPSEIAKGAAGTAVETAIVGGKREALQFSNVSRTLENADNWR
jgi:hypothetical protein